jgi:precorrin-2 methylase
MAKPIVDYLAILKTLRSHGVDFVVVGGVCAVLHGAPLATFDLHVVHSREPRNLARLMAALEEKEETGQEKDKAVLPVLRRVLEERAKS